MSKSHAIGNALLVIAALLMLVSLSFENVTTTGDYSGVLLTAIAAMTIADVLCARQFFLRRGRARWIAALIASPSVFVLWDFARRAPYIWNMF
jgi:phosphoglycerol transferase MdoB-like AlkP superfamily enzyme